ncbi:MAG: S8 family serine peptidase, partial [Planctomycetes bacterium]|nr:S8 family serine peptidase [Planctomycetota bacterium]
MKLERSRLENWLRAFSRAVWCTAALGLIGVGVASAQTEQRNSRKSGDRQELNILEDDPFINPAKAFETMPLLPVEVERLLPPDGREAVEAMMDYFNGTSVEDLFIDGEIMRSNLDQAQRATELHAIGNVPSLKTRDANRQRANEFRRLSAIARNEGTVRVILQVSVPNIRALTQAAVGAQTAAVAAQTDVQLAGAIDQAVRLELAPLAGMQHTVHRVYQSIPFMALEASEQAMIALERSPGIIGIEEDTLSRPFLNNSTKQIGADEAWDMGFDGDGFLVAILDTGLLASHEMFSGKTIVQACFAGSESGIGGDCPNGQASDTTSADAARPYPSNFAGFDHGTHVAGIACGSSPDPGVNLTGDLWRSQGLFGVAREAGVLAIQVFHKVASCISLESELGRGSECVLSFRSDQVGGLDHVFSLRTTHNIASANMSLGGGSFDNQSTCDSNNAAVKAAIDNLRGAGIATVIASGNDGFCDGISGPGCISSAVAVGAVDGSDNEASFSNHFDSLLDLYAPGSQIRSSVASGDTNYGKKSGTSMATHDV